MTNNYIKETKPGISIVTVCKNREESLKNVLPSWLKQSEVNEIVILDWSSDKPLKYLIDSINDQKVVLLEAPGQEKWILSHAYNLAIRMCSYENILKLDSDILLNDDITKFHRLDDGMFYTGNWQKARNDNEKHLNGVLYIKRNDFLKVNGYNEYIKNYGWDDSDLYQRLEKNHMQKLYINNDTFYHIPHENSRTAHNDNYFKEFEVRDDAKAFLFTMQNKIIAEKYSDWSHATMMQFDINRFSDNHYICTQKENDKNKVDQSLVSSALYEALRNVLDWGKNDYKIKVSKEFSKNYTYEQLSMIYASLNPIEIQKEKNGIICMVKIDKIDLEEKFFDFIVNSYKLLQNKYIRKLIILKEEQQFLPEKLNNYVNLNKNIEILSIVTNQNLLDQISTTFIDDLIILMSSNLDVPKNLIEDFYNRKKSKKITIDNEFIYFFNLKDKDFNTNDLLSLNDGNISYFNSFQKKQNNRNTIMNIFSKLFGKINKKDTDKKKIYVHPQHGLANRIRAVSSAWLLADNTDRELIIIWEKDMHCNADFKELFKTDLNILTSLDQIDIRKLEIYNYMDNEEGSEKDKYINEKTNKDIYIKSAYMLNHAFTKWKHENEYVQKLVSPQDDILSIINNYDTSKMIGVHIRQGGGKGHDQSAWNRPENWSKKGQEEMYYWRDKSRPEVFIKRMHELIEKDQTINFYLATDEQESYDKLIQEFGDRITYVKREVFDRSLEQQKYALVDIVLLSKTTKLLGSNWSSFSEIARRLGNMPYEKSGIDF